MATAPAVGRWWGSLFLAFVFFAVPQPRAYGQQAPSEEQQPTPAPGQPSPRPELQPRPLPFPIPFPTPGAVPAPREVPSRELPPPAPRPPTGPLELPPIISPGFPPAILPGAPPTSLPTGEVIGPQGPGGPIRSIRYAPFLSTPFLGEEVGRFQLQTFLTVEEEFSDNINQVKDNRQSELRTSIAPGLSLGLNRPGTSINLSYAFRFFFPDGRLKDTRADQSHNLSARTGFDLTPLIRLGLSEDLTRSNDFRDVGDISTRQTGGRRFLINRAAVETAYAPPEGARAGLSYSHSLARDERPGGDTSQTHTVQTNVGLTTPRFGLDGSYALSRGEFDIASSYWAHSVVGSARHPFTPSISGVLTGSFTHHDSDFGQDFITYGGRVGASVTLGPTDSLDASGGVEVFSPRGGSSSLSPSIAVGYTRQFALFSMSAQYTEGFVQRFQAVDNTGVSRTRSASLFLSSLAFRNLGATLGFRWAENHFEQSTAVGGPADTVDRTYDVTAGLSYSIFRWLSASLGYSFTIRTSSSSAAEFYENRVRVSLTAASDVFSFWPD